MIEIKQKTFPNERDLYNAKNLKLINCKFAGEEDGESALKESENVALENCFIDLRYPLWHVKGLHMLKCAQTQNCRASIWYSSDIKIDECELGGIKSLRECEKVQIANSMVNSAEFSWRTNDINVKNSKISGEYAFFECKKIVLDGVDFSGKYSFQYCENLTVKNSKLNTKDAFWHAKNVLVEDSEINGEYLGWYSENLTFVRCKIRGTQPLCYCKNLTLIDCEMEEADLAFEYSEVNANLKGSLISVKNVLKGNIVADEIGEIISSNSVYKTQATITQRNK